VPVDLIPVAADCLKCLAVGTVPPCGELAEADDALPPPHVALRALTELAAGCDAQWVVPYHIIDRETGAIVGGCGFKGAPVAGVVEVGYGIASNCQRRGHAHAGLLRLLELARATGVVTEVVAAILPDNIASSALARKLGFVYCGDAMDADGLLLQRWHWRCLPDAL
jgi:[ribosomal protein S5]-alanine N-acetyltransferase